ncbi:MAG: hypothetical protein HXY19_01100 [Thermoanaerobaculaceae bacterium]|nr:hypothetical protein [Thermoanaerobaculaceae bacterium]
MPEPRSTVCVRCAEEKPAWWLSVCPICGKTVCHSCATFAYGRYFCCNACAAYFFHGDPEEEGSGE